MTRVLLLLPTSSYRAPDFLEAARRLSVEVTVASEEPNVLAGANPAGYLDLQGSQPEASLGRVLEFAREHPLGAVLGVDDSTALLAAEAARALGLKGPKPESVRVALDKRLSRKALREAGVRVPRSRAFPLEGGPDDAAGWARYPCVLKPATLSASRGVMRADSPAQFRRLWGRLEAIIGAAGDAPGGPCPPVAVVEDFVPGPEFALEALAVGGVLRPLALFDKPDPLDGPFFEETLYVRPSRRSPVDQRTLWGAAAAAVRALGLDDGPVHAELRLNSEGPCVIEVAPRPIGGRCSRALRPGPAITLEELVLRQALGMDLEGLLAKAEERLDRDPSGVMMIPTPGAGILKDVKGVEEARAVAGIEDILIMARPGIRLVPLPEGSVYFGFIFAGGASPSEVESSLREAHRRLSFRIEAPPSPESPGGAAAPSPCADSPAEPPEAS